jgi:hypothetical protein
LLFSAATVTSEYSPPQTVTRQAMTGTSARKRRFSETESYPAEISGLSPLALSRHAKNDAVIPIDSESETESEMDSETQNFPRIPEDDHHNLQPFQLCVKVVLFSLSLSIYLSLSLSLSLTLSLV